MPTIRSGTTTVSITLELTSDLDPMFRQRRYQLRAYLCGIGAPTQVAAVVMDPEWFHEHPDRYVASVIGEAMTDSIKELTEMLKDIVTEVRLQGRWPV